MPQKTSNAMMGVKIKHGLEKKRRGAAFHVQIVGDDVAGDSDGNSSDSSGAGRGLGRRGSIRRRASVRPSAAGWVQPPNPLTKTRASRKSQEFLRRKKLLDAAARRDEGGRSGATTPADDDGGRVKPPTFTPLMKASRPSGHGVSWS